MGISFAPADFNQGFQQFLASSTFTVPPGIFAIEAELWGGGGGGGGGGGVTTAGGLILPGGDGGAGGDTWVQAAGNKARAGTGGGGGGASQGTPPSPIDPIVGASSIQTGLTGTGFGGALNLSPIFMQWQNTSAPDGSPTPGSDGNPPVQNTGGGGQAGGGSNDGANFGQPGAAGRAGEYAKWMLTVAPGDVLTVTIGAGGAAGAAGVGINGTGGAGAAGAKGLVRLAW